MELFAMTFLGFTFAALWLIPFFILWVMIALWPANLAAHKGYSFWGFFLVSLFFWWITLFVVLFLPNKNLPPAAPAV